MEYGMETYKVKIKGVCPLLAHNPSMIGVKGSGKKSAAYDPDEEAKKGLYLTSDGKEFIPSTWILGCLREAGKSFTRPGHGNKTLGKAVVSYLRVNPDEIVFTHDGWKVDARPVVVQRQRIIRWRPRFDDWEAEFTIRNISPDIVSIVSVFEVLKDAGFSQGIGDFRPQYGQFEVTSFVDESTGKELVKRD
jgi:hypothetical protein